MQVDTLNILVPQVSEGNLVLDTNLHVAEPAAIKSTVIPKVVAGKKVIATDSILTIQSDTIHADTIQTVSKVPISKPGFFNLFSTFRKASDSSLVTYSNPLLIKKLTAGSKQYTGPEQLNTHNLYQKNWVLGIALVSVAILILIRVYFQKYLNSIISSLYNIQAAEKLMREKNVLIRRVFVLLNLNFILAVTLYIYLVIQYLNIQIPVNSEILIFLGFLGLLLIFLLFRLALQYSIGYIFDASALFKEYIHNTYLLNKNLGLFLLPLVLSIFYFKQDIADILFYICGALILIMLLYRYLRAIQIIIKYKVLLFYSFLYFCTLEILPVSIGIKYILSLR